MLGSNPEAVPRSPGKGWCRPAKRPVHNVLHHARGCSPQQRTEWSRKRRKLHRERVVPLEASHSKKRSPESYSARKLVCRNLSRIGYIPKQTHGLSSFVHIFPIQVSSGHPWASPRFQTSPILWSWRRLRLGNWGAVPTFHWGVFS